MPHMPACTSHETCQRPDRDTNALHNRIFKVPQFAAGARKPSDDFLATYVWSQIDAVVYMNLEHRTDRRRRFEEEMEGFGVPKEKLHRVRAVHTSNSGHVGFSLSCARMLDLAIENNWKRVIFCEDDFTFAHEPHIVIRILYAFLRQGPPDWDAALMAYGTGSGKESEKYPYLVESNGAKAGSGYVASKRVFRKLRDNFLESAKRLGEDGARPEEAAGDIHWNVLHREGRWFLFFPKLGYQTIGASDIVGSRMTEHCSGADEDGRHCIRT